MLQALTPRMIREWHHDVVASGNVSANTAAKCYRLLRTILDTAVADDLLAQSVPDRPRERRACE
jgi:hypothetical protein